MKRIFFVATLLVVFGIVSTAHAAPLYDYSAGSGTSWPGWTWFPNGADDYGNPGWRKDNGQFVSGNSDWRPRSFAKQDYGNSTLATIDPNTRAPSTATGGSLSIYDTGSSSKYQACWWWVPSSNFVTAGYADSTTNRWSFYVQYSGLNDPALSSSDPTTYNVEIGTYLYPDGQLTGSSTEIDHFYHQLTVPNGAWLHVLLDRHPQHQRGVQPEPSDNPDGPTNPYYAKFSTFYFDIPYAQSQLTSYNVDELEWYTQTQPENDISISSVWVGYWNGTNRWEIGFADSSWGGNYNDSSVGTYEIRYSNAPITNANFSSATLITPLYNGSGGRIRRPNSWKHVAWTAFQLPATFQASNNHVYFALKDVSAIANGDGHDSPSPYIKTIDYYLSPGSSTTGTPAAPSQLIVQ